VGEPIHRPPKLKGALHTHTRCSDGDLTPAQLLRIYRDLGFDFVALTDHDFLMRGDAYERERVPDEFEGMLVYKGVEKSVFARGYVHINLISGVREQLNIFNHPGEYGLPVGEVMRRIGEVEKCMPIHAVEVTLKGFYTPEYDVDEIPRPKVASDDSHTLEGCGRAWVEVNCEKDRDTILLAIKNGKARICYTSTICHLLWSGQGGMHRG
jgi:hypothetical protein